MNKKRVFRVRREGQRAPGENADDTLFSEAMKRPVDHFRLRNLDLSPQPGQNQISTVETNIGHDSPEIASVVAAFTVRQTLALATRTSYHGTDEIFVLIIPVSSLHQTTHLGVHGVTNFEVLQQRSAHTHKFDSKKNGLVHFVRKK